MKGLDESALLRVGQVDLRHIARDDHLRVPAHTGEEHAYLRRRRVLGLVEDDHRVAQRTASHEGQRRYLDHVFLHHVLQLHLWQHILQRVVERLQIRVDLVLHVTRQEAQLLTSLYGRAAQDDLLGRLVFQGLHGQRYREIGLSRACRTYGEDHIVVVVGFYQPLLILCARLDGASRHRIDDDSLRNLVLGAFSLDDVQDILLPEGVEAQHVLAYPLDVLLKRRHLLLVAEYADDIVASHDAQLRIQRPDHL